MAVDLGDLIESLRREVSQPGAEATTFPDSNDDIFFGHLQDGFWETVLDGVVSGYTEADGLVEPIEEGGEDLGRELQQLVVIYAGMRIVRNQLLAMNSVFRAKAGPVEYETQKAASVLKAAYDSMVARRNYVLAVLSANGSVDDYYIDAVLQRDENLGYGGDYFWG